MSAKSCADEVLGQENQQLSDLGSQKTQCSVPCCCRKVGGLLNPPAHIEAQVEKPTPAWCKITCGPQAISCQYSRTSTLTLVTNLLTPQPYGEGWGVHPGRCAKQNHFCPLSREQRARTGQGALISCPQYRPFEGLRLPLGPCCRRTCSCPPRLRKA